MKYFLLEQSGKTKRACVQGTSGLSYRFLSHFLFFANRLGWKQVTLQETKSMPEGAKERGVGLSGPLDCVANVERIIFDKLNARRVTALAPSPAEVSFLRSDDKSCLSREVYGRDPA